MTLAPGDDLNETSRQRTRDQIELLREAHGTAIIVDSDDPADFTYVCSSEHVLVNSGDVATVQEYFTNRASDPDDVFIDSGNVHPTQPRDGLFTRYVLPTRRDAVPGDRSLLVTLDEMDQDPALADLARPDHLVHICPRGSQCPATEPAETGLGQPWPPVNSDPDAGDGVRVVVIDGGWYDPTTEPSFASAPLPWSWLGNVTGEPEPHGIRHPQTTQLRPYAGHGTFVAGVVRAMAPKCTVHVLSLPVDPNTPGGGVFESDMVAQLDAALAHDPQLINLSAGCPTRNGLPARAFENWWADVSAADPERDLVFVAAAGNNSSPWQFWPASFDWAVGVGSLDRDGRVSDFSNWGLRRRLRTRSQCGERLPQRHLHVSREPQPRRPTGLRQVVGAVERDLVLGAARHGAARPGHQHDPGVRRSTPSTRMPKRTWPAGTTSEKIPAESTGMFCVPSATDSTRPGRPGRRGPARTRGRRRPRSPARDRRSRSRACARRACRGRRRRRARESRWVRASSSSSMVRQAKALGPPRGGDRALRPPVPWPGQLPPCMSPSSSVEERHGEHLLALRVLRPAQPRNAEDSRSCSRARALVGPMLPLGIPSGH